MSPTPAEQYYSDKILALQAEVIRLREALEKIAYWKSDARVCCFPVDIYGLLAEKSPVQTVVGEK